MPPRRTKDTPAKLAKRIKRRWRVILLRSKGELLGFVDGADAEDARRRRRSPVVQKLPLC
jgi:hypothetical protein